MLKIKHSIVSIITPIILFSACSGGLEQTPMQGEITFEGWTGSLISGATLWLRVYKADSPGVKGPLHTEYTERGINLDPLQHPKIGHYFNTNMPPMGKGEPYLIEVHLDVDLDGVISPGDAVEVELIPFEAKGGLDTVVIPVIAVP